MLRMYCTFISLLSVTLLVLVTSQSTWNNKDSRICQQSFIESKLLHGKVFSMAKDIEWIKEFRESLLPGMETDLQKVKNMWTITNETIDCRDVQAMDRNAATGIYTIKPSGQPNTQVYCDMDTDGGGWLVFQRRQDGSEDFYRNWTDYKKGFGRLDGEFWLGNDVLASITNQRSYELRVDLEDFEGNNAYAAYAYFSIAGEEDKYRLSCGRYSGTAGDSLLEQKGQQFSTFDSDNDRAADNCVDRYKGAWWHKWCHHSNLNGKYFHSNPSTFGEGINWYLFKGHKYSLKFTEMKIRPK